MLKFVTLSNLAIKLNRECYLDYDTNTDYITKNYNDYVTILAVSFASCSKEDEAVNNKDNEENEGKFFVALVASTGSDPSTKVDFVDKGTSGVKLTWSIGDKITLYNPSGDRMGDLTLESDEGNQSGKFTGYLDQDLENDKQYTAVYPASDKATLELRNSAKSLSTQVQNGDKTTNHLDTYCCMKGMFDYSGSDPNFTFSHENAMMTVLLAKPVGYNSETDGYPNKLIVRNGEEVYVLSLNSITNWDNELTTYLMIDPCSNAQRSMYYEVTTTLGKVYSFIVTSSKEYIAGKRYSASSLNLSIPFSVEINIQAQKPIKKNQMQLPLSGNVSDGTVLVINWGSTNVTGVKVGSTVHGVTTLIQGTNLQGITATYASEGTYNITISSNKPVTEQQMPAFHLEDGNDWVDSYKLIKVNSPLLNCTSGFGNGENLLTAFSKCSNLTSLPSDLFKYNTSATSFGSCFSDCSNLTSLPSDLFKYNTSATNFAICFSDCSSLTSLPSDLFQYNTSATNFAICFSDCSSLTSLPSDLFKSNELVNSFWGCFSGCKIDQIPYGFFQKNIKVTDFSYCFNECKSLTSLPSSLFLTNVDVLSFESCFRNCSSLVSLPNDLFKYNSSSTSFESCFGSCSSLVSLPNDLFRYNTSVTSFASCFSKCFKLSTLPSSLFQYNTSSTSFESCFSDCTSLILTPDIFIGGTVTKDNRFNGISNMNFKYCFWNVGQDLNSGTSVAPDLWSYIFGEGLEMEDCFTNAKINNNELVPSTWGSPVNL